MALSVCAKCDSNVSHGFSDTSIVFNKFDYEGKRGKKAVSGKKKVLEFRTEFEKSKHFCENCYLEGGFPGTRPPLRR